MDFNANEKMFSGFVMQVNRRNLEKPVCFI